MCKQEKATAPNEEDDSCSSKDIYLSPDERYQVWVVKASERPHLLELYASENNDDESSNSSYDDTTLPLPLTDGCDIPSWREKKLVNTSLALQSVLSVGQGCSLLRRERQLPLLSTAARQPWEKLRDYLLHAPVTESVPRIDNSNDNVPIHPWFERQNIPVIIDGCTQHWNAVTTCTFEQLVARFGDTPWRFSDTHGEVLTLETYQKYIQTEGLMDDAPLGVYDSQFGNHDDERAVIKQEYAVPKCFDTDLFRYLAPDDHDDDDDNQHETNAINSRPPFRWILIGPARSGTGLHIDPVGTHAWVTLLEGCKRWVLFPPGTNLESIHMIQPQIPSAIWFREHHSSVMKQYPDAVEILQRPGETVYVPAGWPHLVINLDLSVAITHNYASEYPCMGRFLQAVQESEPALADRLVAALQVHRPDLILNVSNS